jgi:hypothetical protein
MVDEVRARSSCGAILIVTAKRHAGGDSRIWLQRSELAAFFNGEWCLRFPKYAK